MKYLKTYEAFQVDKTDLPDEKLAKEKFNDTEEDLKEYKTKKSQIDQLYSATKNPQEIEAKLAQIMPEKDGEEPNPFLTDYLRICRLQKEIEDGKKSKTEDKIKLDDYQQDQKLSSDKDEISKIGDKIDQIKDRDLTYDQLIAKKYEELKKLTAEHKQKMAEIEKELKDDTQLFSAKNK